MSNEGPPTLLADSGIENRTKAIEELIDSGVLQRVLAQTEIACSNSMIEFWWRSLKHQWLFLNQLDSVHAVERLVEFYVEEHNTRLPQRRFEARRRTRCTSAPASECRASAERARGERKGGSRCSDGGEPIEGLPCVPGVRGWVSGRRIVGERQPGDAATGPSAS